MPNQDSAQKKLSIVVPSLDMSRAIAQALSHILEPGVILLLEGNLGSGKTTFVQALGEGLGIQTAITSPTFTLIDEYMDGRIPLYHMDLYRLDPSQVKDLHLHEYWRGADFPLGIVAIEWAERLSVPLDRFLKIKMSLEPCDRHQFEDRRQIEFQAQGNQHVDILTNLANSFPLT
jgi:tRNA threonylcarbamoyladenosine biosynthesis protein TsaE